jgi:hypothetical protein
MKTLLFLCFSGLLLSATAQDIPPSEPSPAVVYEAPVIYQAPVVYQLPVLYLAPVYYLAPACDQVEPPTCCSPSVVVFIGGHEGAHAYANCGTSGSTLFQFGAEQACAHGYQFNIPR